MNEFSKITFDQVPEALSFLIGEVNKLNLLLSNPQPQAQTTPPSEHIRIKECSQITGRAEATIRTLAHFKKIPYYKDGKFLAFNRSEILNWLQSGRPTIAAQAAENYIYNSK